MIIGRAVCKWCGYVTTTGGIVQHWKQCLKNPENMNDNTLKRQKAHPVEVPNSELPSHLQELIAARELDSAIKLMDKSVHCLFIELPDSVANHHKEIWLNLKKLISKENPERSVASKDK